MTMTVLERPTGHRPNDAREDAIAFLQEDHDAIRAHLRAASDACRDDTDDAAALIARFAMRMQIHDTLEEELLYPLAAMADVESELLSRAALDHTIMSALVTELQSSLASGEERVRILAEIAERFERHVCDEEEVLLPALAECDTDLAGLGEDLGRRRDELVRALARVRPGGAQPDATGLAAAR